MTATTRYTRTVGWRSRVSFVLLVVLAALPATRTVCTVVCDPAASTLSAHHGVEKKCNALPPPAADVRIGGLSGDDCSNHDASVRHIAATAVERFHSGGSPAPIVSATAPRSFAALAASASAFEFHNPPGAVQPATIPLVLRV